MRRTRRQTKAERDAEIAACNAIYEACDDTASGHQWQRFTELTGPWPDVFVGSMPASVYYDWCGRCGAARHESGLPIVTKVWAKA